MQANSSPSPRVYRLCGQYTNPQTDSIFSAAGQAKLQGQRTLQGWQIQPQVRPRLQGPGPRETISTVLILNVNSEGWTLTSLKKNVKPSVKSAIIVGGLDTSQMYAEKTRTIATGLRSIT